MGTSLRTAATQLQDGTNLAGQDLDTAMHEVAAFTPQRQRGRGTHRVVRAFFNPQYVGTPYTGPWLTAHNFAVPNLQTPSDFYNPHRLHDTRVDNQDPTSTTVSTNQFVHSTKLIFPDPSEVTRFAVSMLIDNERTATFLYGAGAIGFPNTWVDNVILSIEVQDNFAIDPGSARFQTPAVVKRDFRVGAWILTQGLAGPNTNTIPNWPPNGAGPFTLGNGLCIDLKTPVSIPANSRVTFSITLPSALNLGFAVYPSTSIDLTALIEWTTECQ